MPDEPLLTAKDVARTCRVTVFTVKRWIRAGFLRASRPRQGLGSSPYLITQADFEEFFQSRRIKPRKDHP